MFFDGIMLDAYEISFFDEVGNLQIEFVDFSQIFIKWDT